MIGIGTVLPWLSESPWKFGDQFPDGFDTWFIGDAFDAAEWDKPGIVMLFTALIALVSGIIVASVRKSGLGTMVVVIGSIASAAKSG